MKLILFIIDVSHTQDDVPPSLPSKEPRLVMLYIYKLLNQQKQLTIYTNKKILCYNNYSKIIKYR